MSNAELIARAHRYLNTHTVVLASDVPTSIIRDLAEALALASSDTTIIRDAGFGDLEIVKNGVAIAIVYGDVEKKYPGTAKALARASLRMGDQR